MIEIWKTVVIKGEIYDNYQVSNLGRLMSLNYRRTGRAELRKLIERKDGYFEVQLSKNGKHDTYKVHQLIAEAFLPNPENKPCVNHKIEGDEGKKINIVYLNEDETIDYEKTTIEWVTYKENSNYGSRNERISKAMTNGKTSKKVLQFSLTGEFIREWESTQSCGRNGFEQGNIVKCCQGKRKSAHGFRWKYA